MAGLTDTGLEKATEAEILDATKQDLWSSISDRLNLSSASPLGQVVGVISERQALLWDALEAVHLARNTDDASGAALTALALLTGTRRLSADKTLVTCTVNVDDGFDQAIGTMVAHVDGDPTARFVNKTAVANATGDAVDVQLVFEAETAGALIVVAESLTVIAEVLTGWNSITNDVDGDTGDEDDTDTVLRTRREEELSGPGSTTADAIRSDILQNLADNITSVAMLVNDTDATDDNGVPPHSFEVIAAGIETDAAASQALVEQIFASKAAGDRAYGSASRTVTDDEGNDHSIGYTWVTPRNVYLELDLEIDEDLFPVDGDDQVKAAIIAIEAFDPGDKVVAERVKAVCFSIPGVIDVAEMRLGFSPSPVGTSNLAIGVREQANFDTSRIEVAHVE